MTRFAITTSVLAPDDAVGNDVLGMQSCLTAAGHEALLFAEAWGGVDRPVRPAAELSRLARDPNAVLIYHHGTTWRRGLRLLKRARCRKVLRYHNVTPASYFEGISPIHQRACQAGRAELRPMIECGMDRYLADSDYNRQELIELGAPPERAFVLPPFHPVDRLLEAVPDPATLAACRDGRWNVLFVGRMVPNKGHLLLAEAFAIFRRHYQPQARLVFVGREEWRLQRYFAQVRECVERLGLAGAVVFAGDVPVAVLRAYYQTARLFVSASAHEGFCVPAIEAMALGVPVVAYGSSALPETVGDAGVVWPEPDPYALAAAMGRVARDPDLAGALAARGRARYRDHYRTTHLTAAFLRAVAVPQGSSRAAA